MKRGHGGVGNVCEYGNVFGWADERGNCHFVAKRTRAAD